MGKEGIVLKVDKLGLDVWKNFKCCIKKKVKDMAGEFIKFYVKWKVFDGIVFLNDGYL